MNPVKFFYYRCVFVGIFLMAALLLLSCDAVQINDPGTKESFKITQQPVILSNANGEVSSVFYDLESMFVDVFDLLPGDQYCIEIAAAGNVDILRTAIVPSNAKRQILKLPMLFDIGFAPVNNTPILSGNYEVRIQGHNRAPIINYVVPFQVVSGFRPNTPTIIPTDAGGNYNGGTIQSGVDLYATGSGFPISTSVDIYVVQDKEKYNAGDALNDISGGIEKVLTDAAGNLPNTKIWSPVLAPAGTALDLIVDTNRNRQFDATDALRESLLAGVVVQNSSAATDIITDLTADSSGNFKDFFDNNEVIAIKGNPPQQPLSPNANAAVYLVNHQDSWQPGCNLVSVLNEYSQDMSHFECIRLLSASKHIFPMVNWPAGTPLPPGNYDVIIDVGRNFVYNPGTDILDGASQIGLTINGRIPSVRTFASTDQDFLPPGATTTIYAKAVQDDDAPIVGVNVEFKITRGAGSLSSESGITDLNGIATTTFSGGALGDYTKIRITFENKTGIPPIGQSFVHNISIWTKISLHNQGSVGTGG